VSSHREEGRVHQAPPLGMEQYGIAEIEVLAAIAQPDNSAHFAWKTLAQAEGFEY